MLVLVAVVVGLAACGGSSSKASTTTKPAPTSTSKPTAAVAAARVKARLRVYVTCLRKHGVTFKSGAKKLTLAEVRAEPKYTAAVAVCKVPAKHSTTTAKSSG